MTLHSLLIRGWTYSLAVCVRVGRSVASYLLACVSVKQEPKKEKKGSEERVCSKGGKGEERVKKATGRGRVGARALPRWIPGPVHPGPGPLASRGRGLGGTGVTRGSTGQEREGCQGW